MRRYNIENRKDAPECMDEPTFDELPFGHTWAESGPKVHETASGMFGALFIILFGSPFLGAGLFTLNEGFSILLYESIGGGLFLIFFSLPFLGAGGMMILGGLYTIGRGIGVIKPKEPKDPSAAPRNGSIGPESIQIDHPESYYSGIYERQSNIINGKDWYRKHNSSGNDGPQRLYFYDENVGGSKGWSLDDRIDNGAKDWFNGRWIDTGESNNIPFGTNTWNDIEGNIVIQELQAQSLSIDQTVSEESISQNEDLIDVFRRQLNDSLNE